MDYSRARIQTVRLAKIRVLIKEIKPIVGRACLLVISAEYREFLSVLPNVTQCIEC